ncbi:MAG: DUF4145 domain-containing protein, partial [Candidatus Omnitrophica bacterium]|nr:DUF4145 domain-containing protein [Candidatus Omnitrophota bacterium]
MSIPQDKHTRECPYCHKNAQFNFLWNQEPIKIFNAKSDPCDEKSAWQRNDVSVYVCCVCGGTLFTRAYGNKLQEQKLDIYPVNLPSIPKEIPDKIKSICHEAHTCFNVGAWNATTTMCRRAVQECIIDKGGQGNTLYNQIDDLAGKRIITDDIKDWAHEIRILGRDGAHADIPTDVGEQEAKFCIEFTDE